MSDRARRRRHVRHLFDRQKGLCHWCKAPMMPPGTHVFAKRKKIPSDLCTLDHLYDRMHPLRHTPCQRGERRHVAACWACNTERGRQSQAAQPIEELWRRSRQWDKLKGVNVDAVIAARQNAQAKEA